MIPRYKKVKILMPHCSVCGERLLGNNSMILPYKCSCGEWEMDYQSREYKIKGEPSLEIIK